MALFGYIVLFMVDMQKMTFLMPFALIVLYQITRLNEKKVSFYLHSYIILQSFVFHVLFTYYKIVS